jgi:hypothetical protein
VSIGSFDYASFVVDPLEIFSVKCREVVALVHGHYREVNPPRLLLPTCEAQHRLIVLDKQCGTAAIYCFTTA